MTYNIESDRIYSIRMEDYFHGSLWLEFRTLQCRPPYIMSLERGSSKRILSFMEWKVMNSFIYDIITGSEFYTRLLVYVEDSVLLNIAFEREGEMIFYKTYCL